MTKRKVKTCIGITISEKHKLVRVYRAHERKSAIDDGSCKKMVDYMFKNSIEVNPLDIEIKAVLVPGDMDIEQYKFIIAEMYDADGYKIINPTYGPGIRKVREERLLKKRLAEQARIEKTVSHRLKTFLKGLLNAAKIF